MMTKEPKWDDNDSTSTMKKKKTLIFLLPNINDEYWLNRNKHDDNYDNKDDGNDEDYDYDNECTNTIKYKSDDFSSSKLLLPKL